jgi:hypothetical protein
MPDIRQMIRVPPKSNLFRWEIGVALLVKIVLLIGLWFLIFRWQDKTRVKPDIAAHFALPAEQADFSYHPQKEPNHDR